MVGIRFDDIIDMGLERAVSLQVSFFCQQPGMREGERQCRIILLGQGLKNSVSFAMESHQDMDRG